MEWCCLNFSQSNTTVAPPSDSVDPNGRRSQAAHVPPVKEISKFRGAGLIRGDPTVEVDVETKTAPPTTA